MKKQNLMLVIILSLIVFSSCTTVSISDYEISNLKISINDTSDNNKLVTITGNSFDSALYISSYSITYKKQCAFVSIKKSLSKSSISTPYFLQFVVTPEVRSIYIQNKLVWTSSVSDYFTSIHYSAPITFIKDYKYMIVNPNEGEQDGMIFKKEIDAFYKYLQKNITINKCKTYCKDADGFVFSNPFIYEDNGQKYFAVNVFAYLSGNKETTIPFKKVDNNDITKYHNIMCFGFYDYNEKGWIF